MEGDRLMSDEERIEQLEDMISELLYVLPDTLNFDKEDKSWGWCWNELSRDAQDKVKAARFAALAVLSGDAIVIRDDYGYVFIQTKSQ